MHDTQIDHWESSAVLSKIEHVQDCFSPAVAVIIVDDIVVVVVVMLMLMLFSTHKNTQPALTHANEEGNRRTQSRKKHPCPRCTR